MMSTNNLSFEEKLIREEKIKLIFKRALNVSYNSETADAKARYEAKNAFSRLIMSILTFSNKTNFTSRIFYIELDLPEDRAFVEKWEDEMSQYGDGVYYTDKLIKTINFYEPEVTSIDNIDVPDKIWTKITPVTFKRMQQKFYKFTEKNHKAFLEAATIVYIRYHTFNAWSQSWTYVDADMPAHENPDFPTIELFGSSFNTSSKALVFGCLFPDVDFPFGGVSRYSDLYSLILENNEQGYHYNIIVNPPNVIYILDDLVHIISDLKQSGNFVIVMFPAWTDSEAFQEVQSMFDHHKMITRYKDMWTEQIIKGKSIKSYLFWDDN